MNIDELKQKPVAMMTGEELSFLIDSRMATWATEIASLSQRRIYYGIEGIAQIFGCSVPTANRIKKSGVIDDAITQIDRQIVIDGNLALELAKKAGTIKVKGDNKIDDAVVKAKKAAGSSPLRQQFLLIITNLNTVEFYSFIWYICLSFFVACSLSI